MRLFRCALAVLFMVAFALVGNVSRSARSFAPSSAFPQAARQAAESFPTIGVTQEQAIAAAVNELAPTADGWRLRQPHHSATFTAAGLHVTPNGGDAVWSWRLTFVGAALRPLYEAPVRALRPISDSPQTVRYPRGDLTEQYVARRDAIEQQFVIARPLPLDGADLVIAGAVASNGAFEASDAGWRWRLGDSAIALGDVRVLDALGAEIPATMAVTASTTRIVVDGHALAAAAYPVMVDPEIGANDFRLSDMGPDGTPIMPPSAR
jgi:hypothetical protein